LGELYVQRIDPIVRFQQRGADPRSFLAGVPFLITGLLSRVSILLAESLLAGNRKLEAYATKTG
jgi:hypothetical protein